MKTGRGIAGLLISIEAVLLAGVIVLGVVKGIRPKDEPANDVVAKQPGMENAIGTEYIIETETGEEQSEDNTEAAESTENQETFSAEITEQLSTMTTEEKVAQMFLISPETLTGTEPVSIAGEGTRSALDKYPIGGLIYSDGNYQGREQFGALVSGAQRYSAELSNRYLLLAASKDYGMPDGKIAISALYDASPLTEAMASGRLDGGAPNIMNVQSFPQERQPDMTATYLMIGMETDEELTGDAATPCALSAQAVEHVRETLGYDGLIVTGNLSQETVVSAYPNGEAAVMAVQAGADLLCATSDFEMNYEAVLAAVSDGRISDERLNNAVGHILTQKGAMPKPTDGDIAGRTNEPENADANADDGNDAADAGNNANAENADNAGADNNGEVPGNE